MILFNEIIKRLTFFFLSIIIIFGCQKEKEITTLRIVNNSSDTILVSVYPKCKYFYSEDLYYCHVERDGALAETITRLTPEGGKARIISTELKYLDPITIINEVIDSIRITLVERDLDILFSIDTVINYNKNIFIEESVWEEKYTESIRDYHVPFSAKTLEKDTRYIFTFNARKKDL